MPAGEWQKACANGRNLFLNPEKLIEKEKEREENEHKRVRKIEKVASKPLRISLTTSASI
jgi:PDZ domain-containing secreted protein